MPKPNLFIKAKFITLLMVFIFLNPQLNAVDLVGADIYYEYLTPLNYQIHLIKYRDCSGPSVTNPSDSVLVNSASNSYNLLVRIDTANTNDPWNGKFLGNPPLPSIPTTCTDPMSKFSGYQYFHYTGTVTLPYAATDWEFRWVGDSRGPNITNVSDSAICLRAGLDNTTRPNNSVVLTAYPYLNLSVNQPLQYLNSPIDPDLDSIVFSVITPGTSSVGNPYSCITAQYNAPYSLSHPMANNGPLQPNPSTGTLIIEPNLVGKYVLKFRGIEYDPVTTSATGYSEREIQIRVLNNMWPVSIGKQEKQELSVGLYPNPVGNQLNIKLDASNRNLPLEVKLYSTFGQLMFSKIINSNESIAVGFLPAGVYQAQVKVGSATYNASFVKE